MTRVSVIVPVYNPGSDIDDCIRSLLGQTLPASEYEAIFVDDGSTDGTGARLDALAARASERAGGAHPELGLAGPAPQRRSRHGQGRLRLLRRQRRLDRARRARADAPDGRRGRGDVLVGKVVGHGRTVPRSMFARNLHGVRFDSMKLVRLLTPHKLFRRAFVEEHGLRFPEGKRRLEDHPFVLSAYFAAERISVLADHPVLPLGAPREPHHRVDRRIRGRPVLRERPRGARPGRGAAPSPARGRTSCS